MPLPFEENKIFSVSELNGIIKEILEGTFPQIMVQGEISNLKTAASGHIYFDLKDSQSLVAAVMFKGYARYNMAKLANGLFVTVRAQVSCYSKQGRYQLIVRHMQTEAVGSLYLQFEKLKAKLSAEGLFEQERKKPLPRFPKLVGVVTSPAGAAVRDILTVLKRRNSGINVIISPALVQGPGAAEDIALAIKRLNRLAVPPDVLLVGRGGGSMEDLWAFNEEPVVRAIAASVIPVISCVGHETDFTLADFAADHRAATPSVAAEMVAGPREEMLAALASCRNRLLQSLTLVYERMSARLETFKNCPVLRRPELLWMNRAQELDLTSERLLRAADARINAVQEKVTLYDHKLRALNPCGILQRGYCITRKAGGVILTDAAQAAPEDMLEITLSKGVINAVAKEVRRQKE